ncbi:triose-phosphate isomerase [Candidatus Peregrinibacteria bacterium]|jgi:triosephosphate isomerase (TIM)|nr:triose-phosphate isomerase [Candidatus Peregrinibacteria bacterium]MBT7736554.1 triose-phosphate isomerase [Candidatus Peregrinibacteria bacterium]
MNLPTIIVNFKIYEQATGDSALSLAKIHEKVAKETGASIGVAVSAMDLAKVCENVDIPVFAQHIDPVKYGSGTGKILPEQVKDLGAYGTLLNHAEFQIGDDVLKASLERAREVGLYTVVCANTPEAGAKIAGFGPDLIAVEPPELIGGDVSVSKAEPKIVEDTVSLCGDDKVLVGAGVKNGEDVKIALALGAKGVLLASGVTKSDDPYAVLMDLVGGLS